MTDVATVQGPLPAAELGWTLMHEHIFVKNPELEHNFPSAEWDEDGMFALARAGMQSLADRGIRTLVDLTVMGLGRSIERIQRVAQDCPVNIVVATGYYTQRDLPSFFHNRGPGLLAGGEDPLAGMFVKDIREGIGDTGVKAGMIKVVTDKWGITPDVERVLEGAARAHLETGVPITTHTNAAMRGGLEQQAFFRDRGVDLQHVVIGHCGDTTDVDYLRELMDNGSPIGLDRFGMDIMATEADRIDTTVRLCELGYADRLTLSHDASFFSVNLEPATRNRLMPNWNHRTVSDRVLPEMRRRGVTDETIEQIMVANPARILAGRIAS
ncbi:MAG: phosphotriesterase-related protein [Mycobacteriales bacterium]